MDPPEECFGEDDNHVGVFEMEGVPLTGDSRQPSVSCVGSGKQRQLGTTFQTSIQQHCAPLAAACSVTRFGIGLLFLALLCMVELAEDGGSVWYSLFPSRTIRKPGERLRKKDPLSKLSPDQRLSLLKDIYGSWTFFDGSAEDRPTEPYLTPANAGNPYLDLAEEKFPLESWQADAVYANHFLDAAVKLVDRAQQAVFTTYHGYGFSDVELVKDGENGEKVDYTMDDLSERNTKRMEMFRLVEIDLNTVTSAKELQLAAPLWQNTGGWTTERSFDGLQRRLIHAMMTNSDFVVVITGSWQSMGYGGSHASQSMPGVFETLLKGLFMKLGVNLVVRAIALPPLHDLSKEDQADGGKSTSTLVHTLGWSSIYGSDVDMVVWDDYSYMTGDGRGSAHDLDEFSAQLFDLFARQALLSGTTSVPFIWGGDFDVLRNLHEHADVDVGQLGNGLVGVLETTNIKTVHELPWAAQYLNCPENIQSACQKKEYQFESICWIDGSDTSPTTPQMDHIPVLHSAIGWRMQQLKGYALSYQLLQAILDGLSTWSEVTISQGFPLPDEYWHVGGKYLNVQQKVKALDEAVAPHCFQALTLMSLPKRLCRHRMNGRTEFTPRAYPAETSIRTLLDPTQIPKSKPELFYEGADLDDQVRELNKGEIDALEILDLQGKRRLRDSSPREMNVLSTVTANNGNTHSNYNAQYRRSTEEIKRGEGWQLLHSYGDGCDGSLSSSSTCQRLMSSSCLMEGQQGSRGGIWGNVTTDWLVLSGFDIENGFVALNLEIGGRDNTQLTLHESIPDSFVFEYAIRGSVTTLEKSQFLEKLQQPVSGMGLLVVVDDDENSQAKDISVAVRVKECAGEVECTFAVTHVYWS